MDAADLHLLLLPEIKEWRDFYAGKRASIRQQNCIGCGACLAWCRFDAVKMNGLKAGEATFRIDPISCEGCGVCVHFCPQQAIDFIEKKSGEWFISETRYGPMVHAKLGIGEGNSGKLVTLVGIKLVRLPEKEGWIG
ncbi:MAG: 4Fe-4S dicluster domain-containing protein [candidate division NC10 bacterium]|nr:4Fe-4S dicluster domain-containing protein [candidate division NC10 bacterium]